MAFQPEQHQHIGEFPTKGVLLHYHFAKLHLYSHVFRGLGNTPVPKHFRDGALAAVSEATSIVELLLTDADLRDGLVGIPHYMHTMTAFACVFLLKVTTKHTGEIVDNAIVYDLTTRLVRQFRSTQTGKYHLVHLMAGGLEKMADAMMRSPSSQTNFPYPNGQLNGRDSQMTGAAPPGFLGMPGPVDSLLTHQSANGFMDSSDLGFATSPFLQMDSGNFDPTFSGFGFL